MIIVHPFENACRYTAAVNFVNSDNVRNRRQRQKGYAVAEENDIEKQWFQWFTATYGGSVRKIVCSRVKNPAWTDDIIQEVYCRVWTYGERMRRMEKRAMEGYLKDILRSSIADYFADRNSKLILKSDITPLQTKDLSREYCPVENHIIFQDDLKILGVVTEKYRKILVLRILYNMSYKDIGAVLGIRETTARKRYERGIKKLSVKAQEIFPT